MSTVAYLRSRFPNALHWSWLVIVVLLAACNNGSNASGGGAY
jgi:hypothetical protein